MKCAVPNKLMQHGHVDMINDQIRNRFFMQALERTARDQVVLDVGTGTGLLSAYALKAGAKYVYAVEKDEQYADIADTVLSGLFDRSRFQVISGDFWTDDIDDKIPPNSVDIMVSETVGPALFEEGMTISWHCAKPFFKPTAISIPDRLHIDAHIYKGTQISGIINVDDIDITGEQNITTDLHAENLLYPEFFSQLSRYVSRYNCHEWCDPSRIDRKPDMIIKDIYTVTKDTIPPIVFSDLPHPFHMQAQIEFELTVDSASTVVLFNQMSFQETTLVLHENCWTTTPCVTFTEPGTYKFIFNPERPIATHNSWIIEKL
jgi:tRNA A58 N-methylase Trm61